MLYINQALNKIQRTITQPKLSQVQSDAQIMEAYRARHELSKSEFSRALSISRQRAYWWLTGAYVPSTEWLQVAAKMEGWPGDMAREMLTARGLALAVEEIPDAA